MELDVLQRKILEKMYEEYLKGNSSVSGSSFKNFKNEGITNGEIYGILEELESEGYVILNSQKTFEGIYYDTKLTLNGINTVKNPEFSEEKLKEAKKFFIEHSDLVMESSSKTYQNNLKMLFEGFEDYPVLKFISKNLKKTDNNFDIWYKRLKNAHNSLSSSVSIVQMPSNPNEKLSLFYEFLIRISNGSITTDEFSEITLAKSKNPNLLIKLFNEHYFKYFREGIISRLDEYLKEFKLSPPAVPTEEKNLSNMPFQGNLSPSKNDTGILSKYNIAPAFVLVAGFVILFVLWHLNILSNEDAWRPVIPFIAIISLYYAVILKKK
jgi:hypothetical protein